MKDKGTSILNWYMENKRDLPWRNTSDPYKIWISEIMLQQTRVDTVIEYYLRFIDRFPDVQTLAEAPMEEVLNFWKGLGYYSRAKNLHKAANLIMTRHAGKFPETYEEIACLPGIGAYTAGAILSIAYNQPYPAVDGNVLRVIARLEGLEADITQEKTKKTVSRLVQDMIPEGRAGDFTQSLMELGALVCIPSGPRCEECPVRNLCTAFRNESQNVLPVRKKSGQPVPEFLFWVAVVEEKGRILLEYRKDETLLGQLWGLPMVEKGMDTTLEEQMLKKYGIWLMRGEVLGEVSHVFSHRIWQMEVIKCSPAAEGPASPALYWADPEEWMDLAIPTAFQKVLKLL